MSFAYWLYRFKYKYGQYLPLTAPVDVALELSSTCQLYCGYCYHADKKNLPFKQKHMEYATAHKILISAADCGVSSIKLNWRGESTLNPAFYYIAHLGKRFGFIERTSNSNFSFKNDDFKIFRGLNYQTKVKISFDSFNKEVFEKQRAGGEHALVMKNIDTFYDMPGRSTEMVIQAVRTKLNKDEDLAHLVPKRWPGVTVSIRDMVEGRVEKDLTELTHRKRDLSGRKPCLQAFTRLIFDWQGRSGVCCPDIKNEILVGDISKHTVKEIFNSQKAKAIRKSLKNKTAFKLDPCLNCSSFESYKGHKHRWNS